MRLRYTGTHAVTFISGRVGAVEPGGEFDVPDEDADRFLSRPDVEPATGRKPSRRQPASTPAEPPAEAAGKPASS